MTGPSGARTQQMLRDFLEHCLRGTNYATGKIGSPLDSSPSTPRARRGVVDGHVRMGVSNQLRAIDAGFEIVASFPELHETPIIIGESDPEGLRRVLGADQSAERATATARCFRATPPSSITRTYELADRHGVNLRGAVTWAFEFEDQPYFDGFRDLATNGIDKPVLNVFRMFGRMGGDRLTVDSSGALPLDAIRDRRRARSARTSPRSPAAAGGRWRCCCGTITTTICPRRPRPSI